MTEETFNISISEKGYGTKAEAKSAMESPYYVDKETKRIDPDVLLFRKRSVTVHELADYLSEGHMICNVFRLKSDVFTSHSKRKDLFLYTHTIIFDMDDAPHPLDEILNSLLFQPTIAYRTYSDGLPGKGNRYRLIYVFEDYINSGNFDIVYQRLADLLGIQEGLDKLSCAQAYYGTDKPESVIVNDTIYTLEEIGIEPLDPRDGTYMDGHLIRFHSELIPSDNGHYFTFPEKYYEVFVRYHYDRISRRPCIWKYRDGEHRRRKLYATAEVLIILNPDISADTLTNVLLRELELFYENDVDKITNECVKAIAERALSNRRKASVKPSDHPSFRINRQYWKERSKEEGHPYNPRQAVAQCRSEMKASSISKYYDPDQTVRENQERINKNDVSIGLSTMYRYARIVSNILTTPIIGARLENILSVLRNNDTIRIMDLSHIIGCSRPTTARDLSLLSKKGIIENTGTKRNPRWVIHEDILTETIFTSDRRISPKNNQNKDDVHEHTGGTISTCSHEQTSAFWEGFCEIAAARSVDKSEPTSDEGVDETRIKTMKNN